MTSVLEAPSVLDAPEDVRAQRRLAARSLLGVDGSQTSEPLRPVLKEHGLSIYALGALGLLSVVDLFQAEAFTILTPEISRSLGLSLAAISGARILAFLAIILAPLPMAAFSSKGRRAMICIVTGFAWSLMTLTTGFAGGLIGLMLVLVADGISTGSVAALHPPLLTDSYPPQARVRVLSIYTAMKTAGQIIAPLVVALLAGPFDLTWRGCFIGMGLMSTVSVVFCLGLKDPGAGRFDTEALRAEEHEKVSGEHVEPGRDDLHEDEVALGFFEILRRVLLIPSVRRLASGYLALGVLLVPFATYLSAFLEIKWDLDASERGVFFAIVNGVSILGLVAFGAKAEKKFREDPAWLVSFCGLALIGAVGAIAVGALMPVFVLMVAFVAVGQTLITVLTPGLTAAYMAVIDARYRPHAAAILGMFAAAGSIIGVIFLSGLDRAYGLSVAIAFLMLPGVVAGLIVRSTSKLLNKDLDRMIDDVLESEDIKIIKQRGGHLPMLACKGIDFSYGQLQVLFDVDFTVDDGEMVALLGTNGAGKSTLLKVVSGIGLPSGGSVRYRGEDITFLDAERRVPLGITQVPGGRAVFGTMDVVENLRTFGYTLGRDKKRIDGLIDECFEAFPRLYERRTSLAATMSGGEQQMLGLSKALILQPRLLLIDELSLGLAPVIVGQLLEMVRKINDTGTAVVLVEQSVNIALSLVDHAYFMEKGEMRFDGPAQQLLERDDLLRAVFLEGASKHEEAAK